MRGHKAGQQWHCLKIALPTMRGVRGICKSAPRSFQNLYVVAPESFQNLEITTPIVRSLLQPVMEAAMDLVYIAGIVLFFGLMVAMAVGCAKLGGDK